MVTLLKSVGVWHTECGGVAHPEGYMCQVWCERGRNHCEQACRQGVISPWEVRMCVDHRPVTYVHLHTISIFTVQLFYPLSYTATHWW